jgi:hypothetical protein
MSAAHPPQTERAAALHPERRVGDADLGVVVTARRCGHEEANTLPIEEGVELRPLLGGEGPEAPSQAELELVAEPFPVHVAEATVVSLADEEANGGALLGGGRRRLAGQRLQVAIGELLDEKCGDDSRQIGAARRHRQRERKAHQVVHRVANDGLVEITDLDRHLAVTPRDGSHISDVGVAADPHVRTLG